MSIVRCSAAAALLCLLAPLPLPAQADSAGSLRVQYRRSAEEYRSAAAGASGDAKARLTSWAEYFACRSEKPGDSGCAMPEAALRPSLAGSGGTGGRVTAGIASGAPRAEATTAGTEWTITAGPQSVGKGGGTALGNFMDQGWNGGGHLALLRYVGGSWLAVMSWTSPLRYQRYECGPLFPASFIEQYWKDGYHLTDLDASNDAWCAVMSTNSTYTDQWYWRSPQFPTAFIEEKWNQGYRITHVAGGLGEWAVMMSKGTTLTEQWWATRDYFPSDVIQQRWNEGATITDLTWAGSWAVVMTRGSQRVQQYYQTGAEFPFDFVREYGNAGYVVTEAAYGGGLWAVVMSRPAVWPE